MRSSLSSRAMYEEADLAPLLGGDSESDESIRVDIEAIERISAVPNILRVISETTGLRLALVARVTSNTWTACAVHDALKFGLAVGGKLDVATTLCSEVRDSEKAIIIEHASQEPAFCEHPTPKMYGFESYISHPLYRSTGQYFGTLCALDSSPQPLRDGKTLELFRLFSDMISSQLTVEENSARDRAALAEAQATAKLREQFIAVLSHDLRNPLGAMMTGSSFLLDLQLDDVQRKIVERLNGSAQRMMRMVEDLMDLARGRAGIAGSMQLEETDVDEIVDAVVGEIASLHSGQMIRVVDRSAGSARVDRSRVGQMVSNLVSNAVEHGARGGDVAVSSYQENGTIAITVANRGAPISPDVIARIFEPYERGTVKRSAGLGLGLHIAREIARAHGGDIMAQSAPDGLITFTIRLPVV